MEFEGSSYKVKAFVKAFMLETKRTKSLRACGEAAGGDLSPAYISRLTRALASYGYISKVKRGRKYEVVKGERYEEFFAWLDENPDWPEADEKVDGEFELRAQAHEMLAKGDGVISENQDRVPAGAWKLLWAEFIKGRAKLCIVPADCRVVIVRPDRSKAELKTWSER